MAKRDPYRDQLLAEEREWMRTHDARPFSARPRERTVPTTFMVRRSAAMARSAGLTPMRGRERKVSEVVGCTVKSLDYRQPLPPDLSR